MGLPDYADGCQAAEHLNKKERNSYLLFNKIIHIFSQQLIE